MANNTLKYKKISTEERKGNIKIWNKANFALLYVLLFLFVSLIFSVFIMVKKKDKEKAYD